ncbi:MAG: phage tail tape measure protein, partial [Huintestinicola sp.]
HYLDVCTKAQSSSNTSLQQLLQAYIGCGGTLKNLNVSMEESAAVLGTLANRGIKGAEAGTALNSILVNLIGANKNAASAMKELGVSAWDENGNFIGLANTLKVLNGALANCTDAEKSLFEARIGGKTQMDTLQALISGVAGEYDDLNEKLNNANGALEATAKTMQDNLTGDITTLKSTLEGVGNTIFDSLEEPFRSAAKEATSSLRRLNDNLSDKEMSDSLKKIAEAFKTLLTKAADLAADKAIPTLIKWLEWIADHGAEVQSTILSIGGAWAAWKIGSFASHIAEMVQSLIKYKAAAAAAAVSQAEMNAAMAVNPYVLLATAIAAVVVGIGTFVKAKYEEKKAAEEALHALSDETVALQEQAEAYKENTKEAEKNIKTIDHNADTMQSLWNEIKLLVDEEGRAIGSSEGLESAISRLNAISGQNIEVVNGQITGYKDLKASMDDIIETQRKQAKLDYLQDDYVNAVYNVDLMKEQQAEVIKQKEDFQRQLDEANEKGERALAAHQAYLDDPDNFSFKAWGFKDMEEIDEAKLFDTTRLEDQIKEFDIQEKSLEDIIASYENTITEYESIANSFDEGSVMDKNEAIAYGFQQDAKKIADQNRKNAELAAMGVKQSWEDLVADLENLDNDLAIKNVSEEDY